MGKNWAKPIRIVELDIEFRSVRTAAIYIEGDYGAIYRVLKGERPSHKGYTFVYVN